MTALTAPPHPDQLNRVEDLLSHFEQLEAQFQQVREGLARSHRLATLGTIASIIAHEYNNILTPMMSYAQLALARPDDQDMMHKAVEKALSGAERAAKISSSLLGFAQEADEQHAARLRPVIDESIACLAREPEKDGIDLAIDTPDLRLAISPLSLQQVLVNLFLNARKAMAPTGGTLTVAAHAEGTLAHLTIADTGPGLAPDVADRVFEPFVTQPIHDDPRGRPERKGTGLGLCICRDLLTQAGGSITVDSTPGCGATFHITLPLADDLFDDA